MRKRLLSKKILTLCIAFGVTFALLTPFVSNVPVFAQEEGVNIEETTDPTEDVEEIYELVDYAACEDDQDFLNKIDALLAGANNATMTLINVPENFELNISKNDGTWENLYLDVCVGGGSESYKYDAMLEYADTSEVSLSFPKWEDFFTNDDPDLNQLVIPGTKYYAFSYPESMLDENQTFSCGVQVKTEFLSNENWDAYYDHSYTKESGVSNIYKLDASIDSYTTLFVTPYENFFIANQVYDGSDYNSYIKPITKDPSNPDEVKEVVQNSTEKTFSFKIDQTVDNIPETVFDIFKEENKQINLNGTTKTGINYVLEFDQINEAKSFNPQLEIEKEEIKGVPSITFNFAHSGTLPGLMKVKVFVGGQYNTETAYLYYINKDGQLEKQASSAKIELGYAEFTIDHCSSYVVSTKEIPDAIVSPSTDGNTNEENTTDTTKPSAPNEEITKPSTSNEETTKPSISKEETSEVDLTQQNTPDTGVASAVMPILAVFMISGAVILTAGVMRRRNKETV